MSKNIYEEYFSREKERICELINCLVLSNNKIAIWGAGQRGDAFLNVYDSTNLYGIKVYDKNPTKFGTYMKTGHCIVDYKKDDSNIVFVMNNLYETSIREALAEVGYSGKIINIDEIILGRLNIDDVLNVEEVVTNKVRNQKIAGVVILYHPEKDILVNIDSYLHDVDHLYVYDNSEVIDPKIKQCILALGNITYIGNGRNIGLSSAYNEVAKIAATKGMDWLITFDQDSRAASSMISKLKEFVESDICKKDVGIVAPILSQSEELKGQKYITYLDKVYQSGAMFRLDILIELNGFDEILFIDYVDYEYCVRMRLAGYTIARVNNAILKHNINDEDVKEVFVDGIRLLINKYSPMRYYYISRNSLYCKDLYKTTDVLFSYENEQNYIRICKSAEHDVDSERKLIAVKKGTEAYYAGDWSEYSEGV